MLIKRIQARFEQSCWKAPHKHLLYDTSTKRAKDGVLETLNIKLGIKSTDDSANWGFKLSHLLFILQPLSMKKINLFCVHERMLCTFVASCFVKSLVERSILALHLF